MKTNYERLPEVVAISVGIPDMTAMLVARTDTKAIYKRWDDVWEVFHIVIRKESEAFGKTYPKREVYPGNEDFGKTAWCYKDEALAWKRYNNLNLPVIQQ